MRGPVLRWVETVMHRTRLDGHGTRKYHALDISDHVAKDFRELDDCHGFYICTPEAITGVSTC